MAAKPRKITYSMPRRKPKETHEEYATRSFEANSRYITETILASLSSHQSLMKHFLDRYAPQPKLSVALELPDISTSGGVEHARQMVINAIASGDLGVAEGGQLVDMLTKHGDRIVFNEIERLRGLAASLRQKRMLNGDGGGAEDIPFDPVAPEAEEPFPASVRDVTPEPVPEGMMGRSAVDGALVPAVTWGRTAVEAQKKTAGAKKTAAVVTREVSG